MFSCAFLDGQNRANRFFQCWLHFTSSPCQITPSKASVKTYENAPDPPGEFVTRLKTKPNNIVSRWLLPCGWPPTSNIDSIPPSCSFFLTKYLEQNSIKPGNLLQELWGCSSASCTCCILCSLNVWGFALGGCHRSVVLRLRCQTWKKRKQVFKSSSLSKSLSTGPHSPTWFHYDHCVMLWYTPFCIALLFVILKLSSFWHLENLVLCLWQQDHRKQTVQLARLWASFHRQSLMTKERKKKP